jgi:hypothetical protein
VLRVTTLGPDGAPLSVEMPVIALADANGQLLPLADNVDRAMLQELRAIRLGIQQLLDAGDPSAAENDLLDLATSTLDIVED